MLNLALPKYNFFLKKKSNPVIFYHVSWLTLIVYNGTTQGVGYYVQSFYTFEIGNKGILFYISSMDMGDVINIHI